MTKHFQTTFKFTPSSSLGLSPGTDIASACKNPSRTGGRREGKREREREREKRLRGGGGMSMYKKIFFQSKNFKKLKQAAMTGMFTP